MSQIYHLEKYFDDGIIQYWRHRGAEDSWIKYRISVQPSGISIDSVALSWNKQRCWRFAYGEFQSLEQAACKLLLLSSSTMTSANSNLIVSDSVRSPVSTGCARHVQAEQNNLWGYFPGPVSLQ